MVTVVASLAADLLHHNLAVGMFARADTDAVVLPRQGQLHLWTLLQVLAPLRAAPGKHFGEVLDGARSLVSGNDLLIVVTPSMQMDWITSLRRVSRSRGGIGRAEVILLDPASFGGHEHAEKNLPAILELGIPATYLRREDVQLISGYYGEVSRWEFSVLGTGRVVTRKKPRLAGPLLEPAQPSWKQRRE